MKVAKRMYDEVHELGEKITDLLDGRQHEVAGGAMAHAMGFWVHHYDEQRRREILERMIPTVLALSVTFDEVNKPPQDS